MAFARWGATEIADAVERALREFKSLARKAEAGALVWRRNNGVEFFVDRLLETADCEGHLFQAKRQIYRRSMLWQARF
jgi:hypothetical protein